METHIYDEKNGLSYTLHGDYYLPDLVLNEEEPIYGRSEEHTSELQSPS